MAQNAEAFTLLSLVLFIIACRTLVRVRNVGFRGLQLDDYLMPVAGILCIIDLVAAIFVVEKAHGLTNSYMTDEQRASLSPDSQEYKDRVLGSKIQVFGWVLYAASLWCIKACVAVFYSRLTTNLAHLQIRVYIAYVFIGVTWVITTLLLLFGCRPMSKYWQIYPDPGICQPTNSKLYVLSVLIPDILTDLYLLSIPLPLLWSTNISVKKKISLTVLFSGVLFVIMAAIIRGVVILTSGPEGAVTGSEWAIREEFVSIVVSNLPILQPPIRAFCNKIGLSVLFSSHKSNHVTPYEGRTIGGGGGSYPLRSQRNRSNKTGAHDDTVTAWDSDERILCENGAQTNGRNIVVTREVAVESESGSVKEQAGWGPSPSESGVPASHPKPVAQRGFVVA
ncbi:hypothetical protein MYCTH_2306113 [Thermothelomyces thermophilus ATCC 42464]|uniref:Rhodopsin domain-containing protein n=1 Tax=Thermothelomyces thermophilus (strain ATCC 42464 / BCRC 31852 / DSM 1799) TaxID=573729 RepID=G2QGX9_THET4|nr:uncharacterized protein MYCTH_2306113 [Thermothelomyces thermophilus ATCC 42464]AEO58639.1 hypothetical protein MYCTH_2306113 [Thermothelomyces thermophilus ATCC 42464]